MGQLVGLQGRQLYAFLKQHQSEAWCITMDMESGLSVCIPTHNGRGQFTCELLDTVLKAAANVPEPVEVIVVDDSGRTESERVRAKCEEVGAAYLRGPRSAGIKRNLAAEQARLDLLFFVDSDCLLADDTLMSHLTALRAAASDVAGIAGRTVMHGRHTPVWRALDQSRVYNTGFDFTETFDEVAWSATCNLSVRRDVFDRVGGFAEDAFTVVGGEDVEFGIRVVDSGHRWRTSATAMVYHRRDPSMGMGAALHKLFTFGRADVFLTERFGRRARADSTQPVSSLSADSIVARTGGTLLDLAFQLGVTWEAVRRGCPAAALRRFPYTDAAGFVPRGAAEA